jgi:hypothetical protein
MAENDQNAIANLVKSGNVSESELKEMLSSDASASSVSVQDWGVIYSSATGQLSEYATVTATNPGNPITGVGMLAYTSNGTKLLCLQYTNGLSSPDISTSIGTTLYTPSMGNQILCIVYGWTQQSSYYLSQTITVVQE